jgi:hypothetical protein
MFKVLDIKHLLCFGWHWLQNFEKAIIVDTEWKSLDLNTNLKVRHLSEVSGSSKMELKRWD